MKRTIIFAALLLSGAVALQGQERKSAVPGQTYGEKIDAKDAVAIAELPAMVEGSKDKKVQAKISAKVLDVCPKKGCWMDLYVNDSTTVFVKMKDYGFFVPMDMIGKTVVLEGEAFEKITSVNELRHYAEDAKKTQAEIDAITQPKKSIRFLASGIVVPQ
jgi:PBP1b-binding outer membrane lipoprotein LpoB